MKTYYAVIEIVKMYKEGYSIDTMLLQKEFATRKEATAFIARVSNGKRNLYAVNEAYIEVE